MNMLEKIVSHICYNTHTSQVVSVNNFRIVKRGFKNQKVKRKISEALLIKKKTLFPLCYLINHRRIQIPVKCLWWGFLVKVFNSFNAVDCFAVDCSAVAVILSNPGPALLFLSLEKHFNNSTFNNGRIRMLVMYTSKKKV